MNKSIYKLTLWNICFLLSLLFLGCDNSNYIEKSSESSNHIYKEANDIRILFARGIDEEKEDLKSEALKKTSELIKRYPNNTVALKLKSSLNKYLNDPITREIYKINKLSFQGASQKKEEITKEALKMASELIEQHPNNAELLRLRSNIYNYLDNLYESLADLEASNKIDPSGEAKLGECFKLDQLPDAKKRSKQSKDCYREAAKLYEKDLEHPEKDIYYVLAGLLSDSEKAMGQFEALVDASILKSEYMGTYEGIAHEYFGKTLDELFPPKNKEKNED